MTLYDFFREYGLPLFQIGASALLGWACWSLRRVFLTRKDYAADEEARSRAASRLAAAMDKIGDRVDALEARVDNLPTEASLHRLEIQLEAVRGDQKEQAARLDSLHESLTNINAALNRMNSFLMEHK